MDEDAEASWHAEIDRRLRELDSGKVKLVPWSEARRKTSGRLWLSRHAEATPMPLVDPETFDGKEVAVVYIASRLSEGKRVEQILSDNAIDYAVDIEPFQSRVLGILPVEYEGVGFYVLSTQANFCRRVLRERGLIQGLVEEDLE